MIHNVDNCRVDHTIRNTNTQYIENTLIRTVIDVYKLSATWHQTIPIPNIHRYSLQFSFHYKASMKSSEGSKGSSSGKQYKGIERQPRMRNAPRVCPDYAKAQKTHEANCARLDRLENAVDELMTTIVNESNISKPKNTELARTKSCPDLAKSSSNKRNTKKNRPKWFGEPF